MAFRNVVFSFNRGPLLENCVRSLRRFIPDSDVVVIDDASDDGETLAVLERLAQSGVRVLARPASEKQLYGGLYANMDLALRLAAEEGRDLVHFVQDDTQLVWHRPDLADHVAAIFRSRTLAYQVQLHFLKRIGKSHEQPLGDLRAYRLRTRGGDLGVFHAGRILERGLRFGSRERLWAARFEAAGLEAYATGDPVLARIPWPSSARFPTLRGIRARGRAEFLVRPLDPAAVARLVQRPLDQRPYGEDWYVPWGWRCWRPYACDPSHVKWLREIAVSAVRRRSLAGLVPWRVGELGAREHPAAKRLAGAQAVADDVLASAD